MAFQGVFIGVDRYRSSQINRLKTDQVKRTKELEAENVRLRRAVSDLIQGYRRSWLSGDESESTRSGRGWREGW